MQRISIATLRFLLIAISSTGFLVGVSFAQTTGGGENLPPNVANRDLDIDQTPFPPPIVGGQKDAPEYTIDITHSASSNTSAFEPAEVAVPVGTTIMWINRDTADHTVSTIEQGHPNSPPESFNSGHIPGKRSGLYEVTPLGGSFIHTFTKPGIYDYFCALHPGQTGRIVVGDAIERGENGKMNLLIGANKPFDATELSRILVAVVPTKGTIDLPPTSSITYNVKIDGPVPNSNSTANETSSMMASNNATNGKTGQIYQYEFVDTDGILDLELIPQPQVSNVTLDFVTWGPDVSGSATGPQTGAFHIKGPVLIENRPYTLTVSITAIDYNILQEPITDKFTLSPNLAD